MRPEDVARYLQDHPEFFEDHAEVLGEIQVPHPHGGRAIPLAERQIVSLREKTRVLEAKLRELVQFGEENDALGERVHRAAIELIRAPDLEAMLRMIYYNLHEDFAQGIAASLMMLQLAQVKDQQHTNFISQAIVQLKDVLTKIRQLSYNISPHFPDWLFSDQLLKNFIDKKAVDLPYQISVSISGKPVNCSNETTLSALRIIEQWLLLLSKKTNLVQLQISILYEAQLALIFKDDDTSGSLATRKKDLTESMITTIAQAQGGSVELSYAESGMNQLKIILPLTQ